jgi:predicted alpha/beta-fold hydrolase
MTIAVPASATAALRVPWTPPPPFVPKRFLRHGHVMTVYAWARVRSFPDLPPPEARLFDVTSDSRVLAHCHWQPDRASRPTLVALHGLEGSSEAHYMRGLAAKAWRLGWNAVRLNQRNCGGTEHLSPGLYHSGLTADVRAVLDELRDRDRVEGVVIVGYSLGGNLAVKLAGEVHAWPRATVRAVAAVSPTIDLARCVTAIERRSNIPYHFNFVRQLRGRMRRKDLARPGSFDLSPLDRIWTIRRFDDLYTAPHHGYQGAADYYHRASALRVVPDITIPTLMLSAADDPFVPADQFAPEVIGANPWVTVRVERHGGHCGFVAEPTAESDGYWAEDTAVAFLSAAVGV